jgi:hypothetical protein
VTHRPLSFFLVFATAATQGNNAMLVGCHSRGNDDLSSNERNEKARARRASSLTKEKGQKKFGIIALQGPSPMGEPGLAACRGYSNRKPGCLERNRNICEFFRFRAIWA